MSSRKPHTAKSDCRYELSIHPNTLRWGHIHRALLPTVITKVPRVGRFVWWGRQDRIMTLRYKTAARVWIFKIRWAETGCKRASRCGNSYIRNYYDRYMWQTELFQNVQFRFCYDRSGRLHKCYNSTVAISENVTGYNRVGGGISIANWGRPGPMEQDNTSNYGQFTAVAYGWFDRY